MHILLVGFGKSLEKLLFCSLMIVFLLPSFLSENVIYSQERPILVYVEDLPSWGEQGKDAVDKAFKFWEEKKGAKFEVVDINDNPDIILQWVKDFGHKRAGHAVFKQFLEVGLGDSHCNGNWNPWHPIYVTNIVTHELGHALGYGHEQDYPDSIMNGGGRGDWAYASIQSTQNQIDGFFTFFPTCMFRDTGTFDYQVKSLNSDRTFTVYFVTSYDELKKASQGQTVNFYEGCSGVDQIAVSGTCEVKKGSGLMIWVDESTTLSISLKEKMQPESYKIYSKEPVRIFNVPQLLIQPPEKPETRIPTEFIYVNNLPYPILEGERRIITGKFDEVQKNNEISYFTASLPNSQILLKNSAGEIIATDITDVNGEFKFIWETPFASESDKIKFGTFPVTLTLEYEGDNKYTPSIHQLNHTITIRGDYYDETKHGIISVSEEGELRVEQNQYTLTKYELTTGVKIAGKVYSDYIRGVKVFVYLNMPDGTIEEHKTTILKDGTFATSLALYKDSPRGWYQITANSLDKELGPIWFNVLEKQTQSQSNIIDDDKKKIPQWVQNNAKWWSEGQIDDSDFTSGIQHLVKEKIIDVPRVSTSPTSNEKIPDWIRNNAKWWASGQISENEFLNGIKFMIEKGIMRVS